MEPHDTSLLWIATAIVFFVAGVTKGVVGLGLPTVSVALLSLLMTPLEAAAILIIPSLVTNAWQAAAGPGLWALVRRFRMLIAGIFVGTLAAGSLLPDGAGGLARPVLGVLLALYGVLGLAAPALSIPPRLERWLSPLAGAATGAISALTGVFVIPAVPYLQGLGLDKDALVKTLGLAFTASTIALAVMLGAGDSLGRGDLGLSVFALMPALAGMAAGQRIRQRMAVSTFRKCLFIGLLALGLHLLLQAA